MLTKSPSSISLRALKYFFKAARADSEIKTTRTFPPLASDGYFFRVCVDLARQGTQFRYAQSSGKKEFKNRFISQTFYIISFWRIE